MVMSMKALIQITSLADKENTYGKMGPFTKAISKTDFGMEKGYGDLALNHMKETT
jgi:hypothetical protein